MAFPSSLGGWCWHMYKLSWQFSVLPLQDTGTHTLAPQIITNWQTAPLLLRWLYMLCKHWCIWAHRPPGRYQSYEQKQGDKQMRGAWPKARCPHWPLCFSSQYYTCIHPITPSQCIEFQEVKIVANNLLRRWSGVNENAQCSAFKPDDLQHNSLMKFKLIFKAAC